MMNCRKFRHNNNVKENETSWCSDEEPTSCNLYLIFQHCFLVLVFLLWLKPNTVNFFLTDTPQK